MNKRLIVFIAVVLFAGGLKPAYSQAINDHIFPAAAAAKPFINFDSKGFLVNGNAPLSYRQGWNMRVCHMNFGTIDCCGLNARALTVWRSTPSGIFMKHTKVNLILPATATWVLFLIWLKIWICMPLCALARTIVPNGILGATQSGLNLNRASGCGNQMRPLKNTSIVFLIIFCR